MNASGQSSVDISVSDIMGLYLDSDIEGSATHSGSITVGVNVENSSEDVELYDIRGLKNYGDSINFTNSGSINVNVEAEIASNGH